MLHADNREGSKLQHCKNVKYGIQKACFHKGPDMLPCSRRSMCEGHSIHIGTFEAAHVHACPCVGGRAVPTFVGNDYFCESRNPCTTWTNILYASDSLWDSQGCGSPPCCKLTSPPGVTAPWFCKQLPQATTDDLEVRICGDQVTVDEDTPVELIIIVCVFPMQPLTFTLSGIVWHE